MSNLNKRQELRQARELDGFLGVLAAPSTIANSLRVIGLLGILFTLLFALDVLSRPDNLLPKLATVFLFIWWSRRTMSRGAQCRNLQWGKYVHLKIFALLLRWAGDLFAVGMVCLGFLGKLDLPISRYTPSQSIPRGLLEIVEFVSQVGIAIIIASLGLVVFYALSEIFTRVADSKTDAA